MIYLVSFLEGVITFISPCLLPMIPVYVSYFAGGQQRSMRRSLVSSLGFVAGFTVVFMLLGALAGTLGSFLRQHQTLVNVVLGAVVVLFGLSYMEVLHIPFFRGSSRQVDTSRMGFFKAVLLGMVFSVGWTPCVGAFLGSALAMASQQGSMLAGLVLLLCYSLGMGIPFVISALLIDHLKGAFNVIKRHYKVINTVCGAVLVLIGLAMATGWWGRLLALLS